MIHLVLVYLTKQPLPVLHPLQDPFCLNSENANRPENRPTKIPEFEFPY
jgi:hypothetical protein